MGQKIIYDATLLVNAYETNLFRTGLFRVCSELLMQILQRSEYEVWLYDVYGRERELREYVQRDYLQIKVLGRDSDAYQQWAYPILRCADKNRKAENTAKGLCKVWAKLQKVIRLRWVRLFGSKYEQIPLAIADKDIYLSTYYPIPKIMQEQAHLQRLIIIHDLIPLLHPEYFPSRANEQLLQEIVGCVRGEDRVVCVSESTRRDFLRYRKDFPTEQVTVAYLAGKDCFVPCAEKATSLLKRIGIGNKPFFLSACTIEPRKNIPLLVRAYERLLQGEKAVPRLVLTGAFGWEKNQLQEDIQRINEAYPNSIVVTGYISDEELAMLYSSCLAFVYPTLYEGFGLPPLEAMQCGAPVIVSDTSSLPEVVGEAGIRVAPDDEDALVDAMKQMMTADAQTMREASLQRAAEFSWEKMCDDVLKNVECRM